MKKLLISILLSSITLLPTLAANWAQIDAQGKNFVDTSSLRKEQDYNRNYVYSLWFKYLNNGDEYYTNIEKSYNKKVWYQLQKVSYDCKNKEFRIDTTSYYDLHGRIIITQKGYNYNWNAVLPDSLSDTIYKEVCKGFY